MNWMLIVVAVILLGSILTGYKKGLVKMVFAVGAMIASIVLVIILAPTMTEILKNNTTIYDKIESQVLEKLQKKSEDSLSIENLLQVYKLPEDISKKLLSKADQSEVITQSVGGTYTYAAQLITEQIIKIIAYILTFLIVNIVIWIVGFALDLFAKLPGISGMNRVAGMALGFVEGIGSIWILFLIISVLGTTEFGQSCIAMIRSNPILTTLYDTNLLLLFI